MQIAAVLLVTASLAAAQGGGEASYQWTTGFNPARITSTPITYTAPALNGTGNETFRGYVTYDNSTTTPRPGVMIIPDIDGIGPYEQWRANLLATLGYTAFIADFFGANVVQGPAADRNQTQAISGQLRSNTPNLIARLTAGLTTLRNQATTDPANLAAIGYCFGGGAVINLARYGPNGTDGLRGVMSFHGTPVTNPQKNFTAGNPIRVSIQNGYADPLLSARDIAQVQAELAAANVTWDFVQYSNTLHAFTNPSNVPGSASSAYNRVADVTSWWALRGFLLDVFGRKNTTNAYSMPSMSDLALVAST